MKKIFKKYNPGTRKEIAIRFPLKKIKNLTRDLAVILGHEIRPIKHLFKTIK